MPVSRRNFVELCQRLTDLDEQSFEEVWRRLGLSVDWSTTYRTIGADSRAISQRAFLRDLARGEAYLAEAPTLWDVTFGTAVAQAEVEDREVTGAYHRIAFRCHADGPARCRWRPPAPSCCPACVALVAHPDDERYTGLIGTDGAHAAVRGGGAGAGAPSGRPGQGHRHRDGLHVRRHHAT